VQKVATRQPCGTVSHSRFVVTPLNEMALHGHGWLELCTLSSAHPLVVELSCAAHANAVVFSAYFVEMHQTTRQIVRETGIYHLPVYSIIHQDF